jgi:hypothetical protein
MGGHTYSSATYDDLKRSYATKSTAAIFTNTAVDTGMNPMNLSVRECRDSAVNPNSLAIQLWLDETGSMGDIPAHLIKNKLGSLIETLLAHKIADPAVLFGGIGDHYSDRYPLQVGQFESGTMQLNQWLTGLYLEGNGGGSGEESYLLAWLVAARHTSIDCFEKRGKKGYLFTVGDERCHESVSKEKVEQLLGYKPETDFTAEQLLREAQQRYHVFHIHCADSSSVRYVESQWKALLGERFIVLNDSDNLAETIATTIAVMEGVDKAKVLSNFTGAVASSVSTALINISNTTDIAPSATIEF